MTNEIIKNETTAINATNIMSSGVGNMVSSFKGDSNDRELSVKIFNALNNPQEKIANHINKEIEVENYLIEMVEMADTNSNGEETGTTSIVPRVVLVTPDGTSYQAVSNGMANVVRNLVTVMGDAPWNPPAKLLIKQQPTKKGSMLTADLMI